MGRQSRWLMRGTAMLRWQALCLASNQAWQRLMASSTTSGEGAGHWGVSPRPSAAPGSAASRERSRSPAWCSLALPWPPGPGPPAPPSLGTLTFAAQFGFLLVHLLCAGGAVLLCPARAPHAVPRLTGHLLVQPRKSLQDVPGLRIEGPPALLLGKRCSWGVGGQVCPWGAGTLPWAE